MANAGASYCHSRHLNPYLSTPRGRRLRFNTRRSMQSEQPATSRLGREWESRMVVGENVELGVITRSRRRLKTM